MTTRVSSADLLAGLSIAGLLLPEAVAYSVVAQLPPQAGVIGVFVGLVCYGLIGRSRFAIVSATRRDRTPLRSMAGAEPLVWPHGTRGARRPARTDVHPVRGVLRLDPYLRTQARRCSATEPRSARPGRRQHRVRPVPRNAGRRGSGTAANEAAGAQTRFAGLFAAGSSSWR